MEPADYARVNAALVENHVLPSYARLSTATGAFVAATEELCTDMGETGRFRAQDRFCDVMDAWMGVQHLHFGPVELFMRAQRFYFWPQARGKVADAVRALITARHERAHLPLRVTEAGVAVQGLLAAEVLLYDEQYFGGHAVGGEMGCELLAATAANMRNMAAEILAEGGEGENPFSRILAEPEPHNVYFQEHRDATLSFFRGLHDGLQFVAEVKLRPVVGGTIQEARPRLAESRLSSGSLPNIIINLQSLRALYAGESGPGLGELARIADSKLDRLLSKAFDLTIATARSISCPLKEAAIDPSHRPKAEKLTTQVRALRQIVRDRLAPALGLTVGFNALDDD